MYGDSAFAGRSSEQLIIACGDAPLTVQTGTWDGQAALERLEAHNATVRRVRCRIEKIFGTRKRSYGLRRMRWIGLAKAGLQTRLTAMAYNIRRRNPITNSANATTLTRVIATVREVHLRCSISRHPSQTTIATVVTPDSVPVGL
jgi:IS5 family transposase